MNRCGAAPPNNGLGSPRRSQSKSESRDQHSDGLFLSAPYDQLPAGGTFFTTMPLSGLSCFPNIIKEVNLVWVLIETTSPSPPSCLFFLSKLFQRSQLHIQSLTAIFTPPLYIVTRPESCFCLNSVTSLKHCGLLYCPRAVFQLCRPMKQLTSKHSRPAERLTWKTGVENEKKKKRSICERDREG